ncbi:MAG TPA: TonB-dependent receptor [Sphingobacteriaceae bacterium]
MKSLYISLLFFFASIFVSHAQSISGKVTGSDGFTLEAGTVSVLNTALRASISPKGEYVFNNIKAGTYQVSVKSLGYETVTKTVTVGNGPVELNFTLNYSSSAMGEVVVSSGRIRETLGKTPVSVTILNAREIQTQSGINPNLSNMLTWTVPGLGFANNTTSNVGQTLRGRNVLILVDGIPQSTPLRAGGRDFRTIDPSVIERIEVIKGSTSAYGNGGDGGLINYITKKPVSGKKIGSVTTVGSTGNLVGIDNSIGGRFSQQFYGRAGKFDYVVSGLYDQTGVFKDAAGEVISPYYGLGETRSYNGYTKLGYNIDQNNRLEGMYNFFGSRQNSDYVAQPGQYGVTPTIGVKGDVLGTDQGTRYNHNANITYTSKRIFGKTDLEANAYFQSFKTIYGFDSFFYGGGQSMIVSDKKGLRANLITPFSFNHVAGSVTYGFDLLNDITSQPLVDGRTWAPEMDMKNLAPYAQINTSLFSDFNFKAGLRYENISIDVDDFNTLATGPDNQGSIVVQGGKLDYNAFTFNAGLRYTKFDYFKPYVSYSEGFSIFELGRILRTAQQNTIQRLNIDPVIVNNYEAGFNSDFRKFNFEAVYYISTSKLGANLVEQNGIFVTQRSPEQIYGYELSANYFPYPYLSAGASYSFVEGKIDGNNDGDATDAADKYLNTTRIAPPKATAYVKVNPVKEWSLRVDYVYTAERDRFNPSAAGTYAYGEGPVRGSGLFNLSTAYKINRITSVNLGIENLFNRKYFMPAALFYGRNLEYTRANGIRYNLSLSFNL